MPSPEERIVPFAEDVDNALQTISAFSLEDSLYDRETVSTCHAYVLDLAEQGLAAGKLTQLRSYEMKLEATKSAVQAAEVHGDLLRVVELGQLVDAYQTVLKLMARPTESKPAESGRNSAALREQHQAPGSTLEHNDPGRFLVDDRLSHWTRKLAKMIPFPSMQFDTRNPRLQPASRLYWYVLPYKWMSMDVFTEDVTKITEGCVVFLVTPNAPAQEVLVYGSDYTPAVEAFNAAANALPKGLHIATEAELPRPRRDGVDDDRQLIELGRMLFEARTGKLVR